MDLILVTMGTYISVKDEMFLVSLENRKQKISPLKIRRIIVGTKAVFTTAVIELAVENNIDFLILKDNGNPLGRFWHSKFGSITTIRRRQLEISETAEGLSYAKKWISDKINHQILFLKDLAKNRNSLKEKIDNNIKLMEENIVKIKELEKKIDDNRLSLIGYEGSSSKFYFEILALSIPKNFKFEGRSRQPAKDRFNAILNYAYGVMYSEVERACIIAGLDPYIGFIHTDNYNRKSLIYDIIENFRIEDDKMVFHMFSKKQINKSMFDEIPNGFMLNKDGKRFFFDEYGKYFSKKIQYGNKKMTKLNKIQAFCHSFAKDLIESKIG